MEKAYLLGIREKLWRADEHLTTLNDEIGRYFESEPLIYSTDADYDAGS